MQNTTDNLDHDKDALHILPLSTLPVRTAGLRRARLIKNWHLDGVVELFVDDDTGSGQISPSDLGLVFQLTEESSQDVDMITTLGPLPSYDVYSLRVELRKLGIEVKDHETLQLSEERKRDLSGYMREFTKPLVASIFGEEGVEIDDFSDLTAIFLNPDREVATRNLEDMSSALKIEIRLIPTFLENYGDVYLSLSYYQNCLDLNRRCLADFFSCIEQIRNDNSLRRDTAVIRACASVEKKLRRTVREIESILELFRARTADMWDHISGEDFRKIEKMVAAYQANIGGALCAITVKMKAWEQAFSMGESGNLVRRADFLRSQILPGITAIKAINYAD